MSELKLNEQIAFLRKQKGITQEDLAQALGVTNQSVSKWESGVCCPDIQLLPELAKYFNVSIDEIMGYKPADTFYDVYLKIKSLFEATDSNKCFDLAYKLAFLLAEGTFTKGYKEYVPWNTDKVRTEDDDFYKWGSSICNEPEGNSVVKRNSVFISSNKCAKPITNSDIREIYTALQPFTEKNVLRVLYALYELTVNDFDLFVTIKEIAQKCRLSELAVENALDILPVRICADGEKYRIEGNFMHIPPLFMMLKEK